jgi:hypothetical protein
MTPLEIEKMRAEIVEEAREVFSAAAAQRFAGDFDAARRLQAAGRRLLSLVGASEGALLYLLEDVLEDAQARGAG